MEMDLDPIVMLSHRYGANADYVLAGGGNTSQKEGDTLAIKASGTQLATIDAGGFVHLSCAKLLRIFDDVLPSNSEAREKIVLEKMLDARLSGQTKRPSVETLLHALFPFRFVVHLHPALVNGMLCSRDALDASRNLFKDEAESLPYTTPGFTLADAVRDILNMRKKSGLSPLKILFLQNHGVFVAADTPDEIESLYAHIFDVLRQKVDAIPKEDEHRAHEKENREDLETAVKAMSVVSNKLNVRFFFTSNLLVRYFLSSAETFAPLSAPFTPDHIVYSGSWPLFLRSTEVRSPENIEKAIDRFAQKHGEQPKILAVQNIGIFSLGKDEAAAERASDLFVDAAKIAWYARAFGGARPMSPADVDFIRGWEVERYRSSVAADSNATLRR